MLLMLPMLYPYHQYFIKLLDLNRHPVLKIYLHVPDSFNHPN
jgi:hypothetical protein